MLTGLMLYLGCGVIYWLMLPGHPRAASLPRWLRLRLSVVLLVLSLLLWPLALFKDIGQNRN